MAQFNKGDRVLHATTNIRGCIIDVLPSSRGRQLYNVSWDGKGGLDNEFESNLIPDCEITDPFERCANGIFGSYSEYAKRNTTFKIKNSNNSTISSLKASTTLFRAYQFKPLLKFLNSTNRRLLVADEVGLGKTIEAGHIMLELKARKELKNVLVVCPKSLQDKWKQELKEKFGLTFKIYESVKELIVDINDNNGSVKAIINYEKIRIKKVEEESTDKKKENDLISYLAENSRRFSLVLCDEAHKLRNNTTKTYKGAEVLMNCADAAVFLTATPVMISTDNLYNLLHLLDNTRYYNSEVFHNLMQQNRPFVKALSDISNPNASLLKIKTELEDAVINTRFTSDEREIYSDTTTVKELFSKDPLYQDIISLLCGEDNNIIRARLQHLLSTMSVMNNVFSRTRKREVTTDMSQAERKPHAIRVELAPKEREEFDNVIKEYVDDNSYVDYWGEEKMQAGAVLGLVQKKRQVASSVYAHLNNDYDLDNGIDRFSDEQDAKFEKLIEVIEEVFSHGKKKIIIFALFRKTLKYLQIRLKKRGYASLLIHGEIKHRTAILEEFKHNPTKQILLSSEVGSEGLDMQFCNSMVNYDLPWNPMVVEQRIGRIDRFGQESPVVNIYNMIVSDSIQETIYTRLLERIGIFRGTIGDMEAILDSELEKGSNITIQQVYQNLEKELFTKNLTEEEIQRKIEEIALAIENQRENIKHLSEGLDNTLTNDAYFQDEINRILNKKSYVTDVELHNYLQSVIRQKLKTCELVEVKKGVYDFIIHGGDSRILRNFLSENQRDESDTSFNQFKTRIYDETSLRLTFDQEIAYGDRRLMYLNIYHPIIQACLNYFVENDDRQYNTFCYGIPSNDVVPSGGVYYLIMYQLSTSRMVQGVEKRSETLVPILFSADNCGLEDDEVIIDYIVGLSQSEGFEYTISNQHTDRELIQEMRYEVVEAISRTVNNKIAELNKQAESDRFRSELQAKEYYKSRIANLVNSIRDIEREVLFEDEETAKRKRRIIPVLRGNIEKLEVERDERLAIINEDPRIDISKEIISINLITVV